MTSILTFYIKGEIRNEPNFVRLKKPNTILSIIPLGAKKESIPINQIASVSTNFKMLFGNFLIGLILLFISFGYYGQNQIAAGIIFTLLGLLYVINSFQTKLTIDTTAGQTKELNFFIFDKAKADNAENMINRLISNRMDKLGS